MTDNQRSKRREYFSTVPMQCANALRKKLSIDETDYQLVAAPAHDDARSFFLYGCMDEVIKASTAMLRWEALLDDPGNEEKFDFMDRMVLEAIYDEQQMWARKLQEILTDMILFKITNEQDYYRLFLSYRNLDKYLGFQKDLSEFVEHESENINFSIEFDRKKIENLQIKIDGNKMWFLNDSVLKSNIRPGGLFLSARQRLLKALELATPDQMVVLGITYGRGYSTASRSVHANIGDPLSNTTIQKIDANLGRIGLLAGHIVDCAYSLINLEPEGACKQLRSALINTEAGRDIQSKLSKEFAVGDIVVVQGIYVSIVTKFTRSKYGYTSCRVHFLNDPPIREIPEDWYSAHQIQSLIRKEDLLPRLKEKIETAGVKPEKFSEKELIEFLSQAVQEMHRMGLVDQMLKSMRKTNA